MGSGITILSMFISSVFLLERRGKVLYFDISDFRRSHYGFNVSARSCCFSLNELFGVTHRARQRRTNQKNEVQTVQVVQSLRSVQIVELTDSRISIVYHSIKSTSP